MIIIRSYVYKFPSSLITQTRRFFVFPDFFFTMRGNVRLFFNLHAGKLYLRKKSRKCVTFFSADEFIRD